MHYFGVFRGGLNLGKIEIVQNEKPNVYGLHVYMYGLHVATILTLFFFHRLVYNIKNFKPIFCFFTAIGLHQILLFISNFWFLHQIFVFYTTCFTPNFCSFYTKFLLFYTNCFTPNFRFLRKIFEIIEHIQYEPVLLHFVVFSSRSIKYL